MYLTIVVVIFTKFVRVALWKKAVGAALTLPEHIGLAVWLKEDNETNRHIYLYCQYFSYFSLIGSAVYHFFTMLGYYIITQDGVTEVELSVTGFSLILYGVFGTFFLMSFQDYNSLESQAEGAELNIDDGNNEEEKPNKIKPLEPGDKDR